MSVTGLLVMMIKPLVLSVFVSQKAIPFIAKSNQDDLKQLGELIATGKIKPIIDRRYSLTDVPDGMRYLEAGHARGKVIINVDRSDEP